MSQSIGQIRISEFESNMGQMKRPRRSQKKPSFPNIDSIKKNARKLPKFEKSKVIVKDFGKIKAFSVNTHQGTVRNYNEDRVSILLNAQQRYKEKLLTKIGSNIWSRKE
jgi:protein phosphatase 2C family protein 2/3